MLNDIDRYSVIANAHRRRTWILQLYNVFAVVINLFLIHFPYIVVVSFAERLSNLLTPNAYRRVPVV
jgi:hypothetical protein